MLADKDFAEMCKQKKEEVEQDLLKWIESRAGGIKDLWEAAEERTAELIPHTTDIQRLWTGMGILVDKFTKGREFKLREREVAAKERDADRAVVDYARIAEATAQMAVLFNQDAPSRDIRDFEAEDDEE